MIRVVRQGQRTLLEGDTRAVSVVGEAADGLMIRVVLVDDHPIVRHGLRTLSGGCGGAGPDPA